MMKPIQSELRLERTKIALLVIWRVFRAIFAVMLWIIGFSALVTFVVITLSMIASGYPIKP